MRAADYVRARVYGRAAEGRLAPVRAVSPLVAPVYEADDEVDVLPRREGGDARAQLVLRRAPGRGVDADAYPVPGLVDITRIRPRVGVAYSGAGRGRDGASPQPDSIKAAAIEQPNAIMRRNLQQFIRGLYRKGPPNERKSAGKPALVRFI